MTAEEIGFSEGDRRNLQVAVTIAALELAEELGFNVDLNQGVEVYLGNLNKRLETNALKASLSKFRRKGSIVYDSIVNELKLRGEYKND